MPRRRTRLERRTAHGGVARSSELAPLSRVPLLLLLLIFMRFQRTALPRGRFDAYDRMLIMFCESTPRRSVSPHRSSTLEECWMKCRATGTCQSRLRPAARASRRCDRRCAIRIGGSYVSDGQNQHGARAFTGRGESIPAAILTPGGRYVRGLGSPRHSRSRASFIGPFRNSLRQSTWRGCLSPHKSRSSNVIVWTLNGVR